MHKMNGRVTKAVVAGTIAVSGLVVGTGSAHADSAYACRSANTQGRYAAVYGTSVYLDSCYDVLDDRRTIEAQVPFQNWTSHALTYCAHALDVNNIYGPWAHDFGCTSSGELTGSVWAGHDAPYGSSWSDWTAPAGTYVISAGVWVDGHYYGDVQSPRTTIG
ncbi:hypothetical protein ACIGXI_26370 [Kitasatospora aureofaciens]|uniref:hypothetical protein n=1 Tax=Kitasatospora aureofaciens TaxID=1894 RepID=UPI0037CB368F